MLKPCPAIQTSIESVEESIFHYMKFMASLSNVQIHEEPDVFYLCADAPVLYLSSVFNARFNGNAGQQVAAARDYFQSRGMPFKWFVTPSSQPENLGDLICAMGGKLLKTVPHMAAQLKDIDRDVPIPSGFRWESVRTHEMLENWASIYCRARNAEGSVGKLYNVFSSLDLSENSPLQLILGFLGDEPVADYSVFLGKELACFYSLSTIPEVRGQGMGTAISIAAADLAVGYGYRTAMLVSDPPSRNICKRVGFKEGYGEMGIYDFHLQ